MSEPSSDCSSGNDLLDRLREQRDDLLGRILTDLRGDDRVQAVWLGGSLGRGTADDWSDLDLGCVIRDDQFADLLDDMDALYRRVGTPVLVGPPQNRQGGGPGRSQSVLFAGPISLDLDILRASGATRSVDTRVVFDRIEVPAALPSPPDEPEWIRLTEEALGFFWAMTPIALKYVGRGATARAVTQIDLLADTFVRLWRLTHQPDRLGAGGANWLQLTEDAELVGCLPRMGAVIDPGQALDTVRSLMRQVALLHPAIAEQGVTIPLGAVREIEAFCEAVIEGLIRQDETVSSGE